jgi:putative two-component system response regulator
METLGQFGLNHPASPQTDWSVRFAAIHSEAKQWMAKGASPEAIPALRALVEELRYCPLGIEDIPRVELLVEIGFWHYTQTRESARGVVATQDAVVLARHLGHKPLLRRMLTTHGLLCTDSGDIGMAIECGSEALAIAEEINDVPGIGGVWNNLGVAMMYAAQFRDAILCFSRACQIAESPEYGAPTGALLMQSATGNIANCHLHLEEFDLGIQASARGVSMLIDPRPHEIMARVLLEYTYTRLLLAKGDIPLARERSMLAKGYAARTMQPRALVAAENAEGLVEVFTGHTDIGLTRLTKSLERAKGVKAAYRDTLIALRMAHEKANRPELAAEYQTELMRDTSDAISANALFHNKIHLDRLTENKDPTGPINWVQGLRMEVLKRKTVEKTLLQERLEMLERLAVTAEMRDDSTGEHSYRVGRLASLLGRELGLDINDCIKLDLAGRLHDIGKIGVPDHILLKAGPLTPDERILMETHAITGAELLSKSQMPELQMAEVIARHHHQRWDGNGYPRGNESLRGEDIPLSARITALADVYDALTHERPYKLAWRPETALDEITRLRGTHFDPRLCDVFVVLIRRLLTEHANLDAVLGEGARSSVFLQSRTKISLALHRKTAYVDPDAPMLS